MKKNREIFTDERKTGDLQKISGVLSPIAKKIVGKKAFVEADVICNWENIVEKDIAFYSKPLKIDFKKNERTAGTLFVETYSGAFALELQIKSKLLIERVNVFFGYKAVEFIKIIQNPESSKTSVPDVIKPQKMLVTKDEENYIEKVSKGLKSEALGRMLQKLGHAIFNDNKRRDNNV